MFGGKYDLRGMVNPRGVRGIGGELEFRGRAGSWDEIPPEPASGLLNERWCSYAKATAHKLATAPEKLAICVPFRFIPSRKATKERRKEIENE